jgi:hypothetical protein
VEDWAEIRRLRRSEGMAIQAIARRLRMSRNTVKKALASDSRPRYQREPKGSIVDVVEPQIRALLAEFPDIPSMLTWNGSGGPAASRCTGLEGGSAATRRSPRHSPPPRRGHGRPGPAARSTRSGMTFATPPWSPPICTTTAARPHNGDIRLGLPGVPTPGSARHFQAQSPDPKNAPL